LSKSRERNLALIGIAAIVILAAVLRFANLRAVGYGNAYYTAAVKSMLQSWHNFFFVAAEPGGSVSVDKPPVGLWLQTISAYFLGVNGFAVILPEIIAGLLSVVLVFHLVRRSFGTVAGLLAGMVLAITPVVIATDRNNTMDSTLILTLLLAAWAFIKATESGRFRYLLLGVVLVGIGFNIKMLEAYLPLPALYGLYLLGSQERLWRKLGKLAVASVLLLVVSFSWAVAVDLTPADQRPYVGSSGDNSELSLIIGYNGVDRLLGMFGGGGRNGVARTGVQAGPPAGNGALPQPGGNGSLPNFGPGQQDGGFPPNGGAGDGQRQLFGRGGGAGEGMDIGQAGVLRLFTTPLSKEVSWLLPLGIVSAGLLAFSSRPRWTLSLNHQALVLWGGWLLTTGVFFSIAGFFHEYYLSTMAPPLAALVGIGVILLWRWGEKQPWLALALLVIASGVTLAFQTVTAQAFESNVWWLPACVILLAIGIILLVLAMLSKVKIGTPVGYACVVVGLWSVLTMRYPSVNQSLPAAYSGTRRALADNGGLQVDPALLKYLEANTQGYEYLMAVPSSMQGADYVIATGRPVLYMGGFNGSDTVVDASGLQNLVSTGRLRFVYYNAGGGSFQGHGGLQGWVQSQCRAVNGYDTQTVNMGNPDGTGGAPGGMGIGGGPGALGGWRGTQISLYDCGG
jgi:4-amino-4-deoxy-L-arabinose transferase-like glycosyltransferase